jgi:hypothetical protein
MMAAEWATTNCYMAPEFLGDEFSLDRFYVRCGGSLPYDGPVRGTKKGEEFRQPQGADVGKTSAAARHFALLLIHDEQVSKYDSFSLLTDTWAHAERDRSQAAPWSPWGGLHGQELEMKPAYRKEFRDTKEWDDKMAKKAKKDAKK